MKNENITLTEQEILPATFEQGNADKNPYKPMFVYDVTLGRVCRPRCLEDAINWIKRIYEIDGDDTSFFQNFSYEDKLKLINTFQYELREPTEELEAQYHELFGNEE